MTSHDADNGHSPAWKDARLLVVRGNDQGAERALGPAGATIGRTGSDMALTDDTVSKVHARIEISPSGATLVDLGSSNGTLLNGKPVGRAELSPGDEIIVGETTLRVEVGPAEPEDETTDGSREDPLEVTRPREARREDDPLDAPLPSNVRASIEVLEGKDKGKKLDIAARATLIGRGKVDFGMTDTDVSRRHASIEIVEDNKVILKDLRSTNGTYLNKSRVTVATLKDGDLVRAGGSLLKFTIEIDKE